MSTVNGWLQHFQANDPVWVATNEGTVELFNVHAQMMTGTKGDGSFDHTSVRPLDAATGDQFIEIMMVFVKRLEQSAVGALGAGADLRLPVVHW